MSKKRKKKYRILKLSFTEYLVLDTSLEPFLIDLKTWKGTLFLMLFMARMRPQRRVGRAKYLLLEANSTESCIIEFIRDIPTDHWSIFKECANFLGRVGTHSEGALEEVLAMLRTHAITSSIMNNGISGKKQ